METPEAARPLPRFGGYAENYQHQPQSEEKHMNADNKDTTTLAAPSEPGINYRPGPLFPDGLMIPLPGLAGRANLDDRDCLELIAGALYDHRAEIVPLIRKSNDAILRRELADALVVAEEVRKEAGFNTDQETFEKGDLTPVQYLAYEISSRPQPSDGQSRPAKRAAARR
jgi:hypothetical protein